VYGPATRELESQIAAVIPDAKKRAEFMQQVFTNFANFLKAMIPDVQAIYQRAAQDIAQFAQGQQAQIAGQEASSAAHISDIASRIGAPAGQAPQDLQAAAKYYATFGALPARTLEESGAGAARYFAELPGIFLQAGAREIAKVLEQAAQREKELRLTLADLRTRQASDILRELESLRAGRRFRESLAFQKQQARQRQRNFERQLEAQLRNADLARRERILGVALQNRKITLRTYARLLGVKGWQSVPDELLPPGYTSIVDVDPTTGTHTIISWPKDQPATSDNIITTTVRGTRAKRYETTTQPLPNGQTLIIFTDPTDPSYIRTKVVGEPIRGRNPVRAVVGHNKKGEQVITVIDTVTGQTRVITTPGVYPGTGGGGKPRAPFRVAADNIGQDVALKVAERKLQKVQDYYSQAIPIGQPPTTSFQDWVTDAFAAVKAALKKEGYTIGPSRQVYLRKLIVQWIRPKWNEAMRIVRQRGGKVG
jgi:hypothetical protein